MNQIKPHYAGIALIAAAILAGLASGRPGEPSSPAVSRASAAALSVHEAAAAGSGLWEVVAASGIVEARTRAPGDPHWVEVGRGDLVRPLSILRTRDGGRATVTRAGDVIHAGEETEVILPRERGGPGGSVRQGSGSVLYEIHSSSDVSAHVLTPHLVAGADGALLGIVVAGGLSSVSVMEGRAGVRALATGEEADLLAGDTAVLDPERGGLEIHRGTRVHPEDRPAAGRLSLERTRRLLVAAGASPQEGRRRPARP